MFKTPLEDKKNLTDFGKDRDYWYMSIESSTEMKFEI
jgi:hypothetical protein